MILDSANQIIELLAAEVDVFLGKAPATPSMLESPGRPPYKSLSLKVEDFAEEMFFKTERRVRIVHADTSDTIARYDECGLTMSTALATFRRSAA